MYTFDIIVKNYKASFGEYKEGIKLAKFLFKETDANWLSEGNNEFLNGCTIRLSYAFNLSGLRIPKGIGTVSGRLKEKEILKLEYYYYYRARDLKNFLLIFLGSPITSIDLKFIFKLGINSLSILFLEPIYKISYPSSRSFGTRAIFGVT